MKIRILLITDDEWLMNAFGAYLGKNEYRMKSVNTGAKGLAEMRWDDFDLVIVDSILPGMSGVDFLRAIPDPLRKSMLIYIAEPNENEKPARDAGADWCVNKPLDALDFEMNLQRLYKQRNGK